VIRPIEIIPIKIDPTVGLPRELRMRLIPTEKASANEIRLQWGRITEPRVGSTFLANPGNKDQPNDNPEGFYLDSTLSGLADYSTQSQGWTQKSRPALGSIIVLKLRGTC
jgi:hypothetical protein